MKIKKNQGSDNKIPLVRFPEFKDGWQNELLGKHIKKTDKKNKDDLNLPVYSINNKEGFLPQSEQFDGVNSKERGFDISIYKIIQPKTFAYNPARINVGSIGYSYNLENILISSLYVCFQTDDKIEDSFLLQFLDTDIFKTSVLRYQEGGVRQYLFFDSISKIPFSFPTLPEQKKIAHFFTTIDQKINQLQDKKNALEQYKKGIMQQIFSQQLRFKPARPAGGDDNGKDFPEWEVKKLGEVATFLKGKGISKNDIVINGKNQCIRYGELYTHYKEVITEIKSATNIDITKLVLSEENDIIIPASGEDAMDIATASCVLKKGIILGGDLNIIRTKNNGVFLSYYLNNKLKIKIASLAQGVSVVHLYSRQLSSLKIDLPPLKEQTKIANFLSKIDEKINTVNKQIAQTKLWKKGLLQKMFVN